MTQAEAHDALFSFLRAGQARGGRVVLVITGKGARGDDDGGRGVLKRMVPLWLGLPEFREPGRRASKTPPSATAARARCTSACDVRASGVAHTQRSDVPSLRRLRSDVLAEFRHHLVGQEPHALALPGLVRAAPVEPDLQQRAERTDASRNATSLSSTVRGEPWITHSSMIASGVHSSSVMSGPRLDHGEPLGRGERRAHVGAVVAVRGALAVDALSASASVGATMMLRDTRQSSLRARLPAARPASL